MAYITEENTGLVVDECNGYDFQAIDLMVMDAQMMGYDVAFYEATENGDIVIWVD